MPELSEFEQMSQEEREVWFPELVIAAKARRQKHHPAGGDYVRSQKSLRKPVPETIFSNTT